MSAMCEYSPAIIEMKASLVVAGGSLSEDEDEDEEDEDEELLKEE